MKDAQLEQRAGKLFPLGHIYATSGAIEALQEAGQQAAEHQSGEWGEMCEEDKQENDFALHKRLRIFSAYYTRNGEKLWVITEADRSVTTILLPAEY